MTRLTQNACRRLCRWLPVGEQRDGAALFRCSGCRSEWARTEGWAPVDADGGRHPDLVTELQLRRA